MITKWAGDASWAKLPKWIDYSIRLLFFQLMADSATVTRISQTSRISQAAAGQHKPIQIKQVGPHTCTRQQFNSKNGTNCNNSH
jgi:hypothetical protein